MKILLIALSFINISIFSQNIDNMCDNLFSSLDKTKENKIAIIEFSSINSKNEDAKIIRERITTKFAGYPKITLVERSLLDKVLSEIKLQTTGIINEKDMTKIGEMTGADYVITGTVNNLKNNKLEINSRIIEIKTGKIISAAKSSIDKDWEDVTISTKTPVYSQKPLTQVAILLDTSNSMDGLIEQARRQIWAIVKELSKYEKGGQGNKIEVALFEYGNNSLEKDKGYIRKVSDFTDDMDKIAKELFSLKTNGGDEYCGWAIKEAVNNLKWDKRDDVYKAIFIAGNEPFTQGPVPYEEAVNLAKSKGIFVNTIFCGPKQQGIAQKWKDGALIAEGEYSNIDQNQISSIETPYDDKLVELNQKINQTYIPYGAGSKEKYEDKIALDKASLSQSKSVLAERASYAGSAPQAAYSAWDLITAIENGNINPDNIKKEDLPEELKKMSKTELQKYINEKLEERKKIRAEIKKTEMEREKFLESKKTQSNEDLGKAVINAIRNQVTRKGYTQKLEKH